MTEKKIPCQKPKPKTATDQISIASRVGVSPDSETTVYTQSRLESQ